MNSLSPSIPAANQKPPVSKAIPLGGGTIVTAPSTPRRTAPAPTKPSTRLDPRFDTCREANDAGYGPYARAPTLSTTGIRTATTRASCASSGASCYRTADNSHLRRFMSRSWADMMRRT
jgi:hypothetical protein